MRHLNLASCVGIAICVLLVTAHPGRGESGWWNWRSNGQDGVAPEGDYPTRWSDTENIAWKIELPGRSGSTPIVVNDRIIVTAAADGQNVIYCYDWAGKRLWAQQLGTERPGKHRQKGSGSNPSPVTDGERVFVYFKSGDVGAFDLQGKPLWHVNLQEQYGKDTLWWDLGTSPVLTSQYVVVACMQSEPGPSYLVALDKQSGKEVWKTDRVLEAPEESSQSYTTPIVAEHNGQEIIVTLGADHVTAHAASDGQELWRVGGLNPDGEKFFRSIASPILSNDIVVAPYARGETLTAIRLGGKGDVTESHVVWRKPQGYSADVPTPAAADGKIYICSDKGKLSCLDAVTGEVVWEFELERNRNAYSSSPILANGLLYATREDGKTFVVRVGEEPELVAANDIGGEITLSTPVFSNNKILLRTAEYLYCIGK